MAKYVICQKENLISHPLIVKNNGLPSSVLLVAVFVGRLDVSLVAHLLFFFF